MKSKLILRALLLGFVLFAGPVMAMPTANDNLGIVVGEDDPDTGGNIMADDTHDGSGKVTIAAGQATPFVDFGLPSGALLSVDTNGDATYKPNGAFESLFAGGASGADSFSYTLEDGTGTDTATVSFSITPADDAAQITGPNTGDVDENTVDDTATGNLNHTDVDADDPNDLWVSQTDTPGTYGSLSITTAGIWTYTLDETLTATEALDSIDSPLDSFLVSTGDGTSRQIDITVNGENDAAAVTGTDTGDVDENTVADTASGDLNHTDVDADDVNDAWTGATIAGTYGSLTIDAAGAWTYTLDDAAAATQALDSIDTPTDTIQVSTAGGTTHDIVITVQGENDAAAVTGTDTGDVDENTVADTASGDLNHTDVDADDVNDAWTGATIAGSYGSLTIDAAGAWTYTLDDTAAFTQAIDEGELRPEVIQVSTAGGTTHDIVITVNGENDEAVVTGPDTGDVDENTVADTASGDLNHTDVDADDVNDAWTGATIAGTYGSLTIDAAGAWTYTLDDAAAATQALDSIDTPTDTIQVSTAGGTTHDIVITVQGENDAAAVTGTDTGDVDENTVADTASGDLNHTDVDADDVNDAWTGATIAGTYGSLTIDAAGAWTYTLDDAAAATQALDSIDTPTDTIQVSTAGGTTHDIVITVQGENDASAVTGTDTGDVDENTVADTASGDLNHTDVDADDVNDAWTGATIAGTYGSLTIDAAGAWTYTLDDAAAATQALDSIDTPTDTIQVSTAGGTTHDIVITVQGENDAAAVTGTDTGDVDENTVADTASGDLNHTDVDADDVNDAWTGATIAGTYGSLTIDAAGAWTYTLDDAAAATQALDSIDTPTDTIQVSTAGGTTHDIVITVQGENDAAAVTGTDTGDVDENTVADTASGDLNHTDVDADDVNDAWTGATIAGTYGSLTIDAAGAWTYTLDDAAAATQALDSIDTPTDTIQVSTAGGTTHDIVITVQGENDAAAVTGTDTGDVDENTVADTASGDLNHTDVDADDVNDAWTGATIAGTYGSLTIDAAGAWTYTLDDAAAATQALDSIDTPTDTIQVSTAGGTTHDIVITVQGENDAAAVTGTDTGDVDENTVADTASGDLNHTDVDADDVNDAWTGATIAGTYGSLTIDAAGAWTYTLDDAAAATQALDSIDTPTDTIQVSTAGGTTHDIVITVQGENDAAAVTGTDTGDVDENTVADTASGDLNHTDVDADDVNDAWTGATIAGTYGSLTIDAAGAWTYTLDDAAAATQALDSIDTPTDTIQVSTAGGTTHDIVITVQGENDAAAVTGTDTGDVDENTVADTASGDLNHTDVDADDVNDAWTGATIAGTYGSLTIDAAGAWTYTLDDAAAATQALDSIDTPTDTIQVSTAGGTTHDIVITVQGENDAAAVTGTDTGDVDENTVADTASGDLNHTDVDADDVNDAWTGATIAGTYGSLTIDAAGAWTYTLDDAAAATQALDSIDTPTDTIQVSTAGGTTHDIVITVQGENDAAAVTGTDTGDVDENTVADTASGDLNHTDVDADDVNDAWTGATIAGTYGSLTIDAAGAWTYTLDDAAAATQALDSIDTPTDTIQVSTAGGTTHDIVITVQGENDAAAVTGTDTGDVDENTVADTASGDLNHTDVDADDVNDAWTGATIAGTYGSLTIDAAGAWTYTLDDAAAATQALDSIDTPTDTIQVSTAGGTTHDIVITVQGENDAAAVTGTDTGDVDENTVADTASGDLNHTDVDADDVNDAWTGATIAGTYGSLTIDAAGAWTYTLDDAAAATQALDSIDTPTDTIQVSTAGGTTHDIVITVQGENDAAAVTGTDTGDVDENTVADTASGDLNHTDVDADDVNDAWTGATIAGTYGSLTIDAAGAWTYTLDDAAAATQALDSIDTPTDTIQVSTAGGTTHDIVITVQGEADAAVITGPNTGDVDENTVADTASGDLNHTDVDADDADDEWTAQTNTAGLYGSLSITTAGAWTYTLDDTAAATEALDAGDTPLDSFTVATTDGTTRQIDITVNGENDAAVISGPNTGDVDENTVADTASGDLNHTDVDADDADDEWTAQTNTAGLYGSLSITTAGAWTYTLDDTAAATEALDAGDTPLDSFTVAATDGTTRQIDITVNGEADAAVITGPNTGDVDENTVADTASGDLNHTDVDDNDADDEWTAQTNTAGLYGSLSITTAGAWTYTLDDTAAATEALDAGDTPLDSFTVATTDGTTRQIDITVNGEADAAVITGPNTGDVDENTVADTASGDLNHTDVDADDADDEWTAQTNTAGLYGSLSITTAGAWTYTLDDTAAATEALDAGDTPLDSFTVATTDGTTRQIDITVNGENDAAVITGPNTGDVDENTVADTASGDLNHTDVDADDADDEWTAQTNTAGLYGSLSITTAGAWTYTLDDTAAATEALDAGDTPLDSFTVAATDGTTRQIDITVNGEADAAVISGPNTGDVDENTVADTASGDLNHTDVDADDADDEWTAQTNTAGLYGSLSITTAGAWTYTLDDTAAATEALDAGDTPLDSFTVATTDGTTRQIDITVNGEADAAVITGPNTGDVDENTVADTASGDLNHTDVDADDADDEWTAQTNTAGLYGSLSITTAGAWTYTLDDTAAATEALDAGDTPLDSFTVATTDGTTRQIDITVNGEADAAVITGTVIGTVTENTPSDTAGADLNHTDADADNADDLWTAQTGAAGKYGTLDIDTAGVWLYTLDDTDADTQALDAGDSVSDETFSVETSDGTSTTLTITINGAADAAVITGTVIGTVTENTPSDTAGADLNHTDVDADDVDDLWTAQTGAAGKYGTLDIDTAGVWLYTLDDTDADTQALDAGDSVNDETFIVATADGTSTTLTLTIQGAADAAVITGTVVGTVTENTPSDTAGADLNHTDVDADNADDLWTAQAGTAGKYGTLDIDTAGVWLYTLDDTDADTQALDAGDSVSDETFSVETSDGTSTTLTITINGAADAAVITGTVIGTVTENTPSDTAGADLNHTDVDADDADDLWTAQTGAAGKYGTLDIDTAGVWLYTLDDTDADTQALDAGDSVSDETFTVATSDGTSTTLTLTIQGAADAAVITGTVVGTVTENVPSDTDGADLNHTDVDGDDADDLWTAQTGTAGKYGTFDIDASGVWLYTLDDSDSDTTVLDAGDVVSDETFSVSTDDGTSTTVTLTVNGANDNPEITTNGGATIDVNFNENTTGTITSIAADDVDGDDGSSGVALTYDKDTSGGADHGAFTVDLNTGAVSFSSARNFEAQDDANNDNIYEVTVRANDDSGGTDTILIRVALQNVNEAPTASNLTNTVAYTEDQGTVNLVDIVVSDIDDSLTAQNITATLTLSPTAAGALTTSGSATYNSGSGVWTITDTLTNVNAALASVDFVTGADHDTDSTITTLIQDQDGSGPAAGLITLDVTPVNDDPTATNTTQTVGYVEDTLTVAITNIVVSDVDDADFAQTITATLTLADPAGGALTTTGTATYSAGTGVWTITDDLASVNSALAAVAFEPVADYDTDTSVSVVITDQDAAGPGAGTITLDVTPVNDAPTATNMTQTITYNEDANGIDALDPDIVISDVDDLDVAQTITVTIQVVDYLPVTLSTPGGSSWNALTGEWTMTDTLASVNAALGALTFDAETDWDEDSSFTVQIMDQDLAGPPQGTVTLDVVPLNDDPVVDDQVFDIDENTANGTVVGTVIAYNEESVGCTPPDPGCQTITFDVTGTAFEIDDDGILTVKNVNDLDREATDSIVVIVTVTDDGTPVESDTANITVNLNPINDNTPVGVIDAVSGDEQSTFNFNVLTAGTDLDADLPPETLFVSEVDGDPLKVGVAQDLTANSKVVGQLTINSDGSATFVATSDNTVEEFDIVQVYTVSDGTFEDSDVRVEIELNPVNDNNPTLTSDGTDLVTNGLEYDEDTYTSSNELIIDLSPYFQDLDIDADGLLDSNTGEDNDSLIYTVSSITNTTLVSASISDTDMMIYSPPNEHGTSDITIRATDTADGGGNFVDLTFTLTVNSVNDAPIYIPGSYSDLVVLEDSGDIVIPLHAAFSDADIDADSNPLDDTRGYLITVQDVPNIEEVDTVHVDIPEADELTEDVGVPDPLGRTVEYGTDEGTATIEIADDAHGEVTVTVRRQDSGVPDGTILFVEETFTITVQGVGDDTPAAADDHYSTNPALIMDEDDDAIIIDVLANDYLGDAPAGVITAGQELQDSLGSDNAWRTTTRLTDRTNTGTYEIEFNGEVSCSADGCQDDETPNTTVDGSGLLDNAIVYKPGPDFNGEDSFVYCIQDAFPGSEAPFTPDRTTPTTDQRCATVTVLVNPVNDLPRVPGDTIYEMQQAELLIVPVEEGLATVVSGVDNTHIDGIGCDPFDPGCNPGPSDPQPDDLFFYFQSAATASGQGELLAPFETDGSFNYRPNATFSGSDSFLVDVCEGPGMTADNCIFAVTVTITVESVSGDPEGTEEGAVEVDFDLANIPLELPVGPEANVLIVNDDSGSMDWDISTDQTNGVYYFDGTNNYVRYVMEATAGSSYVAASEEEAPGSGVWRLRNSDYNSIYYNPEIQYTPWKGLNASDTDFPNSNPNAALHNPLVTSGSNYATNLELPQDYTGRAVFTSPITCSDVCTNTDKSGNCTNYEEQCTGGNTSWQSVNVEDYWIPRYYTWDDKNSNGVLDANPSPHSDPSNSEGTLVEIRSGNTYPKYEDRTDCISLPSNCSYAEELQNFANWFTYNRNREFTAKSALGQVVAAAENIRIGYAKLNSSSNIIDIQTMNSSERTGAKADLLDAIYLTGSSGGTPLRRSLEKAGRFFECKTGGYFGHGNGIPGDGECPVYAAPAGNCQQNFTLLISDGTWNGSDPYYAGDADDPSDGDDPTDTNFDGGVYTGNIDETLADVAMHFYERDLHTLGNEVPTTARDRDGAAANAFEDMNNEKMHQHMKTYTIGFGVSGVVEDDDVPTDYTQSFNWGNPYSSNARKIDDMRHAAVNGRGQYLSAGNASGLADALLDAFDEFQKASGSASAVSFNSQEVQQDTLVFRAFYNTKNNTGDLIAQDFDVDENGVVIIGEEAWNAAAQLDLKTFDERVIITLDRTTHTGIPFRPLSLNSEQRALFISDGGAPVAQQNLEVLQKVNYLRGDSSNERPAGNFRERPGIEGKLGDIVHSAPTFIGPPNRTGREPVCLQENETTGVCEVWNGWAPGYADFVADLTFSTRSEVVYVASNDGMFHGFDAVTGDELIAYVPDNLMTGTYSNKISGLLNYEYVHEYFVDSSPAVNDVHIDWDNDGDKEWRTVVVNGQGAGAKAYFALDITDPSKFTEATADQVVMWEFTDEDDAYPVVDNDPETPLTNSDGSMRMDLQTVPQPVKDLGYTLGVPTLAMSNARDPDGTPRWIAAFGNGYNSTAGIAKLFVLFLDAGVDGTWCHPDKIHNTVLGSTPLPSGCTDTDTEDDYDFVKLDTTFGTFLDNEGNNLPNGLGEVRLIDFDGNGTADYGYAGDMQGNLFRFNMTSDDFLQWSVTKIFEARYKPGTVDETIQPITTQGLAITHPTEEEGIILMFGTGAYMRTGDATDDSIQSIYGIWDRFGPEEILKSDLVEQWYTGINDSRQGQVRVLSDNPVDYSIIENRRGWFIDLDTPEPETPIPLDEPTGDAQFPGERAIRNIQVRGGLAFTASVFPRPVGSCVGQAGGALLSFCPDTGSSECFINQVFDLNNDGSFNASDDLADDNRTGAGVILTNETPPTDSAFIGSKIVTQQGTDLTVIDTNTSFGANTGRTSWRRLNTNF